MTAPNAIFTAYLSGAASAFFEGDYTDRAARERVIARVTRPLAPDVADALDAQNARLAPSPARGAHLASLRQGAAAVVTGQQCGLFLGPLYTLYKAASAVAVARALASESGRPVVPVFWLQTEDHDLAEIALCHVQRAHGSPLALKLPASASDRVSIGHRPLPEGVGALLGELRAELGNLPHAETHLGRLERHYRAGNGWGHAFAHTIAELFADEGLVVIDPRDPAMARVSVPIHRRALADASAIAHALIARGYALEAAGYEPAVHVRPGAPLSFFHHDGPAGPRHRLQPAGEGAFTEVGGVGTHSLADLLAALDADPLRFSTSALLRPVLQDSLLPTAAYVAGPGEVAYLAQVAPLYAAYDLVMPLVVPRARFRVLEQRTLGICERLGITPNDADRPAPELLAASSAAVGDALDHTALERALVTPFETTIEALRRRIERVGPGLDGAIDKTRAAVAAAVGKLARKIENARAHRDRDRVEEVQRVRWAFAPHGVPQERFYGFPYFAARYGERAFVTRVLDSIAPFDPAPRDLVWAGPETSPSATSVPRAQAGRA